MTIYSNVEVINQNLKVSELISKIEYFIENQTQFTLIEKKSDKLFFLKKKIYTFYFFKHLVNNLRITISEKTNYYNIKLETNIIMDFLYLILILIISNSQGKIYLILITLLPIALLIKYLYLLKLKKQIIIWLSKKD